MFMYQMIMIPVGRQTLYESKDDSIIEADRYRVAQLVTNLLGNALKFVKRYDGFVYISIEKKGTNEFKHNSISECCSNCSISVRRS